MSICSDLSFEVLRILVVNIAMRVVTVVQSKRDFVTLVITSTGATT